MKWYEKLSMKLESVTLPFLLYIPVNLFKIFLFKIIDLLNYRYEYYKFDINIMDSEYTIPSYQQLEAKYKYLLQFDGGLYKYSYNDDGWMDIGDFCLHNGLYAAYKIHIHDDISAFERYFQEILVRNKAGRLVLLRGIDSQGNVRDDASGDQLAGFIFACHVFKEKKGGLPLIVKEFFDQWVKDGYKLYDLNNEVPRHGYLNPNPFMAGFPMGIVLAGLAVSENWSAFFKLYYLYGYGLMIPHLNLHLWDGEYKGRWFWKKGQRSWFNSNLSAMMLFVLYKEDWHRSRRRAYISSFKRIIKSDGWNLWVQALARKCGAIDHIATEEALDYFETWKLVNKSYDAPHFPLGGQSTDWVWQRGPYKKENNNRKYGRLDFLYVYGLCKDELE